jgi:cyclopropane fatty-acyl-phospholipid synthase-like methyltransferase
VADLGCGHGATTLILAAAYPESQFTGVDGHAGSIEVARKRAADAGLANRATFELATEDAFTGKYDLVTMFDCLHDMGDPVGAARRVREALAPGGTLLLVEPQAGDAWEENFNPVGAAYYGFSTLLCTPSSLSQPVGAALGAQAGPARLSQVLREAGFGHVRRVADTPFNLVIEARS